MIEDWKFPIALDDVPIIGSWISVNDRLPELEGNYLVTDGYSAPFISRMMKMADVKGWVNDARNPPIKYWMPLPEPPKEDEDG